MQAAGVALESMAEVAEGLTVDVARMRREHRGDGRGGVCGKGDMKLARGWARGGVPCGEESMRKTGSPPELPGLREPEEYLGSAETFSTPSVGWEGIAMPFAEFAGMPDLLPAGGRGGEAGAGAGAFAGRGPWDVGSADARVVAAFSACCGWICGAWGVGCAGGRLHMAMLGEDVLAVADAAGYARAFCIAGCRSAE